MRWDEGTSAISNCRRWSVHSRNELYVLLSSTYCTACAVTIPMGSEVIDSVSSVVVSSLLSVTVVHEQFILHVAKRVTLIAVDSSHSLECMLHSYCYTHVICPASWENAIQFILECLKKDVSCCDYCDIRAMDHGCGMAVVSVFQRCRDCASLHLQLNALLFMWCTHEAHPASEAILVVLCGRCVSIYPVSIS